MHEYSSNPNVVERVREELAWVTKFHRRYVEIRPEDARELIDRWDQLTVALTEITSAVDEWTGDPDPSHVMVMDAASARARAALSDTPRESEA